MESKFRSLVGKKNVIYITVKNKDYIRTSQIRRFLKENASGVTQARYANLNDAENGKVQ